MRRRFILVSDLPVSELCALEKRTLLLLLAPHGPLNLALPDRHPPLVRYRNALPANHLRLRLNLSFSLPPNPLQTFLGSKEANRSLLSDRPNIRT